ncbi:MAG: glycosyltransferase [Bacillaceae bacterium]
MIKNILIISSDYTGHGHKSITEALNEKFGENVNVTVVDGFSLGGQLLMKIGKMYGPITRTSEKLWKVIWEFTGIKAPFINRLIQWKIEKNFLQLLDRVKPDLILTVHPNFNGSVVNILEKHNISTPFLTLIADLISISPFWADPRVDCIISPTEEAKEKCIHFGVSKEKIKVLGFPVRSRFYQIDTPVYANLDKGDELKCLIMSGGEGVGNMEKIADTLVTNFPCRVKIIAGRNEKLKKQLEVSLQKHGEKVEVFGFLQNIQDLMMEADIAFTRGSPNVMMEAVCCHTPLVITGALPGQEEGNPYFAQKYNLAVSCKNIQELESTIGDLLSNNCRKLNEIKQSQYAYADPTIVDNIVAFITNFDDNQDSYEHAPIHVTKPAGIQVSVR